jgi:hypothetical protein
MHALHTQQHRFRSDIGRPLVSLILVGFLCLVVVGLAACSSVQKTSRSTPVPTVALSPTPDQNVFVHLVVQRQTGRIASGTFTLYVTLTLANARSAPIGLLGSCIVFSLWNTGEFPLWNSAPPCLVDNYDFAEVRPGQTYAIEKTAPLYIIVPKGLEAGTYVLLAQFIRWHEGHNVPGTPIAGAQGDASGQASVELS